jgi:hypothetical protein
MAVEALAQFSDPIISHGSHLLRLAP